MLELAVLDTGIGLQPEQLSRLFQPFAQADVTTTRRFGGTGLGLFICKQLALLMGGDVHAESTPGSGSCFGLCIPLGPDITGPAGRWLREHSDLRRGKSGGEAELAIPALSGSVLVAEDGIYNQRLITAYLHCTGASVKLVDNGERAVEEALAGDFDLVLMDIQMPVMDGITAITLLRSTGYGGPVVALTANVMRSDIDHYRQIGCDDVLAKPIDRSRLHRVLSRYLPSADSDRPSRADQIDAVVHRLAADFRADLPATLATLSEALAQGDFDTVRFTTHRIKGLAGSIGYPELTALAEPVERDVDAGRLDAARDRCELLMNAMQTLVEAKGVIPA